MNKLRMFVESSFDLCLRIEFGNVSVDFVIKGVELKDCAVLFRK